MKRTNMVSIPNLENILKISTINKAVTYCPNTSAPNLLVIKLQLYIQLVNLIFLKQKYLKHPELTQYNLNLLRILIDMT